MNHLHRSLRLLTLALALAGLAACGGVQIRPDPKLPDAIIAPMPARVGLVIPPEVRDYTHSETRWGVGWKVHLGEGHATLVQRFLESMFTDVDVYADLGEARRAAGLKAVFEPRIEQYSFVTARETGGRYYAVTIRYRINLYTPVGELADSFTLTGYGNALAKGMSSGAPLQRATLGAMRDAAAKFLTQFPDLSPGKLLAQNEAVVVERRVRAEEGGPVEIEAVPIFEQGRSLKPPPLPTTIATTGTAEPPVRVAEEPLG
jgi:hypothetical protein